MALARDPLTKSRKTPDAPDIPADLRIGDVVYDVSGSSSLARRGILRYLGPMKFAKGTWAGIELESPEGKNDGSVQGHRCDGAIGSFFSNFFCNFVFSYFDCKPNFGIFVLAKKVMKAKSLTSKVSRILKTV